MMNSVGKNILKKFLNQSQRRWLAAALNQMYGRWMQIVSRFFNFILPARFRVFLRNQLKIVKRIDYSKDIFLDISSPMEYSVRRHSCRKEPETIRWIEEFFKEEEVFFDVGANVGVYSLVAAKFLKGRIAIYAFEPSFINFSQMNRNIIINKFEDTITPLNIALSDKTAISRFNYSNLEPGGALHNLGEAVDFKGEAFQPIFKQAVLSYALDDLIREFRIPFPNHIKLDVDGIEMSILKGAQATLLNPCLRSILVEMGDDQEIISFLNDKGFRIHARYPQGAKELGMSNCIFLKS